MKLGTNTISTVKLGTNQVQKVYLGTNEVWSSYAYLLDDYSGAAAAYSLRKLRSAYTGNAIRVRRASDNTEQNIGFVNNELDTSALTTFCSGTNGFVTTWYDQSGNGYNATQTTAANQPQIVSSGSILTENGKPAVEFDGINDGLLSSVVGNSENYASISVCQANSGTFLSTYFSGVSLNFVALASVTNYYYRVRNAAGTINTVNGAAITTDQRLLIGMHTSTLQSIYVDNNSPVTSAQNFGSIAIGNGIGIGRNVLPEGFLNGKMQEAIIYLTNQSSNISGIQTNINSFYSIY
jgi:hypothetical protein